MCLFWSITMMSIAEFKGSIEKSRPIDVKPEHVITEQWRMIAEHPHKTPMYKRGWKHGPIHFTFHMLGNSCRNLEGILVNQILIIWIVLFGIMQIRQPTQLRVPCLASTPGASGCSFVWLALNSGSASFVSHIVVAIASESYFLISCWRVSQTLAPYCVVVVRSTNFLYNELFDHKPWHSSQASCSTWSFPVPRQRVWTCWWLELRVTNRRCIFFYPCTIPVEC